MKKFTLFTILLLTSLTGFAQQKQLTLEDAIINRYRQLAPNNVRGLQWVAGSDRYSFLSDSSLIVQNAKGSTYLELRLTEINQIIADSLKRMPSIEHKTADQIEINTKAKTFTISLSKKELVSSRARPQRGANTDVSPQGIYAYTVENKLYLYDGKEKCITPDDDPENVYGQAVSRYEFGISKGTFWSPKGNYLAFYMKDESRVSDYPLVNYMTRVAEPTSTKYPMAGMPSEHVQLGIYSLKTGKTVYIDGQGDEEDYLTNISWSPDEAHIYIQELNRGQDHMQLNKYDAQTGKFVKTLFEEKAKTYVEPQHTLLFSKVKPEHFYLLSNMDGFYHVYKYDTDGKQVAQLTLGDWDVTQIVGFDRKEKTMFVVGTKASPLERHLYKVDTKSKDIRPITQAPGNHSISMSDVGDLFIDQFQSTDVPGTINVIDEQGSMVQNILTSKDNAADYAFGENRLVEVPCPDGEHTLYGRMILPPNFDSTKQYPVIVYVYGGPHAQLVRKTWKNAARWWQYYMAQQGYIAFTMDNRGTPNRGRRFEDVIHRQLGVFETADQMAGVAFLKSLPYVDSDRMGVHGWSYGGYMTLNLMMRHPETFKVGVAGGPVVSWDMYEVMYGERYMDRPDENPEGYENTDMTKLIPNLEGDLLIIHGVQDPTVVMQHAMKFLRACVKEGKQVDFFAYPTHPHNVRGKDRVHLMEKVSRYFMEKL